MIFVLAFVVLLIPFFPKYSFLNIENNNMITFALAEIENNNITITKNENVNILNSWNDGSAKERIINFVKNITNTNSSYYISPENRIAVFDNDGTLWSEKPTYFQIFFALDRLKNMYFNLDSNLKIQSKNVQEVLDNNFTDLSKLTEKDAAEILLLTHSNISQTEFNEVVSNWSKTAKHPQTDMYFVNMVYQPMLELLNFLKIHDFKIFIVSGGGIDFIRESLSTVYDIPYEQIIGSSLKYKFVDSNNNESSELNMKYNDLANNSVYLFRSSELNSYNDNYQKPENIQLHIGKIPIISVGNSDGDLQMLEYSFANNNTSLPILVHHDDAEREYSYDKRAEKTLKEAQENNWLIVSMKNDFKEIYPK